MMELAFGQFRYVQFSARRVEPGKWRFNLEADRGRWEFDSLVQKGFSRHCENAFKEQKQRRGGQKRQKKVCFSCFLLS